MLRRGGRSEEANVFLGLHRSAPDLERGKVRPQAAMIRREVLRQGGRYARYSIASR